MGERAAIYVPYVLAVLFPPVGVILGAVGLKEDREMGMRLITISLLAAVVWVFIFVVA
jgi:spore maturation protein SpmB